MFQPVHSMCHDPPTFPHSNHSTYVSPQTFHETLQALLQNHVILGGIGLVDHHPWFEPSELIWTKILVISLLNYVLHSIRSHLDTFLAYSINIEFHHLPLRLSVRLFICIIQSNE